jgi:Amt family ammonium transporter
MLSVFVQETEAKMQSSINSADTAWVLVSTALVLLMTPALGLFYAGMARTKNVLNILMQSFVALSVVSVLWAVVGYSLAFAKGNSFVGGLDYLFLKGVGQDALTLNGAALTVPHLLFMAFQMMFAIITPALISGAIVERMKFSAYLVFIALWSLLVYSPVAHMVWGEGGLFVGKALDFAGGTVVHITSGFSALALALLMGKRRLNHSDDTRPHNLPMVLLGAGLVWFGWFGFNAGSALTSGGLAASALVTTHIAAAVAGLVWILLEWVVVKKPTALGFATGAVAGLVAITPGAGFVTPVSAMIIGAVVPFISYGMIALKNKFKYDDTLDVFAVHGCGGLWGAIATVIFADKAVNSAGFNGLLKGDSSWLMQQLFAVGTAVGIAIVGTVVIYTVLKLVFKTVNVSSEEEAAGLDITQHGESGYVSEN